MSPGWRTAAGVETFGTQYKPFGVEYGTRGTHAELKLTGQHRDSATGLYYQFRRLDDPDAGRFVGQDRILGHLTVPRSLNEGLTKRCRSGWRDPSFPILRSLTAYDEGAEGSFAVGPDQVPGLVRETDSLLADENISKDLKRMLHRFRRLGERVRRLGATILGFAD